MKLTSVLAPSTLVGKILFKTLFIKEFQLEIGLDTPIMELASNAAGTVLPDDRKLSESELVYEMLKAAFGGDEVTDAINVCDYKGTDKSSRFFRDATYTGIEKYGYRVNGVEFDICAIETSGRLTNEHYSSCKWTFRFHPTNDIERGECEKLMSRLSCFFEERDQKIKALEQPRQDWYNNNRYGPN